MNFTLEICANGIKSALAAVKGGAQRIELCAALPEGGITPSYGVIKACRAVLTQCVMNVMIRPRGGDFLYDNDDLKAMLYDIKAAKDLGADGLVFGCLDVDGNIDRRALDLLMPAAAPLAVTFHRAFDLCRDPHEALETLISYKVARILTSGQRPQAMQGAELIGRLNTLAAGRISIMPGSGVNPQNLKELYQKTHCHEFHFSAKVPVKSAMGYRPAEDIMSGTYYIDQYDGEISSPELIAKTVAVLQSL